MNPAHVGKFQTGAKPSPRWVLASAIPYAPITRAVVPPEFAYVPAKLSSWGNQTYGCCVTSEEAFAKACASPEIFIPEQTVIDWAAAHGDLNGASLNEVLDRMTTDGFVVNGVQYNDGGKLAVNYADEATLQSALSDPASAGPVKIAIDSTALPAGAGAHSGWSAFGGPGHHTPDHCVSVAGYGPCAWLFQQLKVTPPASAPADGYLVYTWATIGVVDHAWLMGTCVEAWTRRPTTPGAAPGPGPGPAPTPAKAFSLNFPAIVHPGDLVRLPTFRSAKGFPAGKYDVVPAPAASGVHEPTVEG